MPECGFVGLPQLILLNYSLVYQRKFWRPRSTTALSPKTMHGRQRFSKLRRSILIAQLRCSRSNVLSSDCKVNSLKIDNLSTINGEKTLSLLEGQLSSVQELDFAFRRAASRLVEMSSHSYCGKNLANQEFARCVGESNSRNVS